MCDTADPTHVSIVGGGTAQIVIDTESQYPLILFSGCTKCSAVIITAASVQVGNCWRHTLLLSYPSVTQTVEFSLTIEGQRQIGVTVYPCKIPKYPCPDKCGECI